MIKILAWLKKHIYIPIVIIVLILIYVIFGNKSEKKIKTYIDKNIQTVKDDKLTTIELRKEEEEAKRESEKINMTALLKANQDKKEAFDKIEEEKIIFKETLAKSSPDEMASIFAKKYNLKKGTPL